MTNINGLESSLNGFLGWNKARISCFARMLLGLIAVRTVNLEEIAVAFSSSAQVSSRYRRLQRFFAFFEMDLVIIGRWIFRLYFSDTQKFYLIIDRTNWFIGQKKINVFMLAIAYEGLAIPLFWHLLDKGGSSNFSERKALITQFIKTFGMDRIEGLLADREFSSDLFFSWLNKEKIPYFIRIKEDSLVYVKNKRLSTAKKIFHDLHPKQMKTFAMDVEVFGNKVFLAGSRSERGELMIVATNQNTKNAIPIYLRRWEIENLFQGLKSRGFSFEDTHITNQERIAKLIALLAVAFVWAHRVGEWVAVIKPIIFKKFHQQKRPQHTYFRYGLDFIRDAVLHTHHQAKKLKQCIKLLALPIPQEAFL